MTVNPTVYLNVVIIPHAGPRLGRANVMGEATQFDCGLQEPADSKGDISKPS